MTFKNKTKQSNQPIKSNQIKIGRSKPVVVIPPFTTDHHNQSKRIQTETKLNHKTLPKTLHDLPTITKLVPDSISRKTPSKALKSTISLQTIKPFTDGKLKTDVKVSKRDRRPLGERDESSYVPIVLIPPYDSNERKASDLSSKPTNSLSFINLQTCPTSSPNLLPRWLKETQLESTMIDPNDDEEIEDPYSSLGFTNPSISNVTSSPSIQVETLHHSIPNVQSNQPFQSTSKVKEINQNQSHASTSQINGLEKVIPKAAAKPISISNLPSSHTESSLEYIDPIDFNPTPTPPQPLSQPLSITKDDQSPSRNLRGPSSKSSVSTIKRKRRKSEVSNFENSSIILDQDGLPISSQRVSNLEKDSNDPFGFQQNEKRLKLLRSKGALDPSQTNQPKSILPSMKFNQSINPLNSTIDSDLSLTDLLSIKRPIKNRKVKESHQVIKNPPNSPSQTHLVSRSNENDVPPILRRGRSKKDTIIINPSSKRSINLKKDLKTIPITKPSLKKLKALDPNISSRPNDQPNLHSSPSPKKILNKSNQLKKLKSSQNQTSFKNSKQVSTQVNREVRLKSYDGLEDYDFEEEVVL
ncbi:hypothetical protein DFH28DRAFT_928287 [Melampsora americana]|nr:hypothetical protein DFH28DRAFT_928287 [Melampsora americana]